MSPDFGWLWPALPEFIFLPIIAIFLAGVYFYYAYGYFSIIVLSRLTKASFKMNVTSLFDLFISYFFAMMIILVLYIHIPLGLQNLKIDPTTATFLGIIVLYLGRIITKNLGVFYGKVHFTAIFLTGGILILYRAIIAFGLPNNLNPINLINNFINNAIDGINFFLINYDYQILLSFFGAIFLATLGEICLSLIGPTEHKLITIMEKLPSGFLTYTGLHEKNVGDLHPEVRGQHHGSLDKLEEILKTEKRDEVKSINCAVSSLWLIERIDQLVSKNNTTKKECDIKVIKHPDRQIIFDYIDKALDPAPSLDVFYGGREKNVETFIKKYIARSKLLKKFKARDFDLGDLAFLIIEYNNGKKCLLLIVFDTGPRMNRVGLFTQEKYIVETFSNLFASAWANGVDYDPDKSEILRIFEDS